jgi:hypothetical protein
MNTFSFFKGFDYECDESKSKLFFAPLIFGKEKKTDSFKIE